VRAVLAARTLATANLVLPGCADIAGV